MATILFAWELGGGLGHCVKLAPLAAQLAARGHDVYFAARDVATAQRLVQNPKIKFLQSPMLAGRPMRTTQRPRTFSQVLEQVGFGDDEELRSLLVAWRNLFALIGPAAVVCEHAPSALLASRWCDHRTAAVGTGFSLPPNVSPLPDLCPWIAPAPIDLAAQEQRLLDRVNRLLQADRLSPLSRLAQLYADVEEQFLLTFRELDHHPNRGPAEYLGCWSLGGGVAPEWPQQDSPRIFAYVKPPPGNARLEPTLSLLRELPVQTLAYVPRATKNVLGLQSKSLRIVTQPVDISAVVQHCDVAILNATAGTTTQCLLGGVPVLLLPHYLEQAALSHRVAELGAGLVAPPNRTELLAARLWKLLQDNRYRQAAERFAEQYADFDPRLSQAAVIDRVESLLGPQTKVLHPARSEPWPTAELAALN